MKYGECVCLPELLEMENTDVHDGEEESKFVCTTWSRLAYQNLSTSWD